MAFIPPVSAQTIQRLSAPPQQQQQQAAGKFPPNLAAGLRPEIAKKMLLWLSTNYIWPQIQERMPFERQWDKLLNMARVMMPNSEVFANTQHEGDKAKQDADQSNRDKARVSDTVVHDAITRLTDITFFIAFKEGLPASFGVPDYIQQPYATKEYRPLENKIAGANAILQWNSANYKVSRQSKILYRHHYTYGIGFVMSDFRFKIEQRKKQNNQGQVTTVPEITELGTTFEPISLRKLWLNWRIPVYNMDMQPCPFWFEETSRWSLVGSPYDPIMNPFGYQNFDKLQRGEFIYTGPEQQSVVDALTKLISQNQQQGNTAPSATAQILKPEYSVEAKWTLFPIMPFDPATGDFEFFGDDESKPVPGQRFVMETWGTNIHSGNQVIVRLQENYYPEGKLPLYGSTHMPDLDSGLYAPSIGQILENHYTELVLTMEQFLNNKDLQMNPPTWHLTSSPMQNKNPNEKGARLPVNGPNDFGWAKVPDITMTLIQIRAQLREEAQTTGKTVDAIMGKAMGARTSASEANNAFEAGMSSITSDIDSLSEDIHGEGYARRVYAYSGMWIDPQLLFEITGQLGFALKPEDMWLNLALETNAGSTYVEKIVKQQNYRYVLESSRGESTLDRALLWRLLLDDMGLDGAGIVIDGGQEQQVQFATLQACETYMGMMVMVDPDQDHQLAIRIKSQFLKDRTSVWNTDPKFAPNAQGLMKQIEQHQFFVQLQQQMMLVQQQMAVAQAQLGIAQENPPPSLQNPGSAPQGAGTETSGQVAQQGGGMTK